MGLLQIWVPRFDDPGCPSEGEYKNKSERYKTAHS